MVIWEFYLKDKKLGVYQPQMSKTKDKNKLPKKWKNLNKYKIKY